MAQRTNACVASGTSESRPAMSTAPDAVAGSHPTNHGTWGTLMTARNTTGPSTGSATGERRGGKSSPAPRETGDVAQAVERDLAKAPESVRTGGLAMLALAMAREIDRPTNSATAKSMCANCLLTTIDRLRDLIPAELEADGLDDLAKRRELRRAGGAAPQG